MTYHSKIKETVKTIAHWYDLDLSAFEVKRLSALLQGLETERVVVKIKEIHKPVQVKPENKKPLDWEGELKSACKIYNAPYEHIRKKIRRSEYVSARAHFVRRLKNYDPTIGIKRLGDFLKKDHTSILHYMYGTKIHCVIEPMTYTKRAKKYAKKAIAA